jgi:hypothetical protein
MFVLAGMNAERSCGEIIAVGCCVFMVSLFYFFIMVSKYDMMTRSGVGMISADTYYPYAVQPFYSLPSVVITQGKVHVDFYKRSTMVSFTLSATQFSSVFELDDVKLCKGKSTLDTFYSEQNKDEATEVMLLDFTQAIQNNPSLNKKKFLSPTFNKWLTSPYLVCCDKTELEHIWISFFGLCTCTLNHT